MTEEAEVAPDFDIGIIGDRNSPDAWQSEAGTSENEQTQIKRVESNPDTERQLRRLLSIQDTLPTDDEQDFRSESKRRRLSVSRSVTASRIPMKKHPSEKPDYTCPSKIAEIFNQDISSENLFVLSAMKNGTPSAVREVMPTASVQQICQMCKLSQGSVDPKSESNTRLSKSRRSKKPVDRLKRKRPKKCSRPLKHVLDDMKQVESEKKAKSSDLDLFWSSFPVHSPTEGK